jgi:protein involved in polysaccharide export with SLBB domain
MFNSLYKNSPDFLGILSKKLIYYAKISIFGFLITFFISSLLITPAYSQSSAQIEGAKARLSTMTPEEIQAKLSQYGMTQDEAEQKAQQYGIDLDSYLRGRGRDTTASAAPQVQINVASPGFKRDTSQTVQLPPPNAQLIDTTLLKLQKPILGPDSIPYFGYNLFKGRTADFDNRPNLTDNSYIIGKGDVLRIALWGDTQSISDNEVDQEGRIIMQPGGAILVAGYTLGQAKTIVTHALGRSIGGLVGRPPTTMMDITIARLRPVHAFILGEVANPGAYSMNTFSTVFNALFTVGGPSIKGGMREIRLVRNGKTAAKVDMYDYLIGSDKTNDIRINDNDIIYVPLRGKTVGIKGAVPRSAYYELLPNENLRRLLDFAGGIRNTFYLQRIQIKRILPFAERKPGELERKIFDVDFSDILLHGKDYKLEDGDIVTIFPIQDEKENYVNIEGAVWMPGTYQLETVPTIKDLILKADSLSPEAYMDRAKLIRTYLDERQDVFYINLKQALEGDSLNNLKLESYDSLRVFSWQEMLADSDSVRVEGMAKHPGTFPLFGNFTLYDLVQDQVGLSDTLFREKVYLARADLIRLNKDRFTSQIIPFNLWDLYDKRKDDTPLFPGDRILIYPDSTMRVRDRYVDISGSVNVPGRYKLSENMTLFDLLLQANGFSENAWKEQAEISRLVRKGLGKDSLTRIIEVPITDFTHVDTLNAEQLAQYRAASFKLQHHDYVFIRPDPKYIFQKTVLLDGEVEHPGSYVIGKLNEHLSDIIRRAGGVKNGGYAEGGKVLRGGLRMRINIRYALEDPEGNDDILVLPNDTISIPKEPFTVMVSGEVNNPGLFSYVDGKSASYYIQGSGGYTDSSDVALLTYPTGVVQQVGRHWWSSSPNVPDGSSITVTRMKPIPPEVVPKDKQTTTFDFVKDLLAIVVSSVTVIVLAYKL